MRTPTFPPLKVEEIFARVKEKWPDIKHFGAHLHNSRGMALPSMYAAIRALGPDDTLKVEGTIGGIGGCPYCGNGQATGMAATEDVMHMLEGMGIETGVNLDKLQATHFKRGPEVYEGLSTPGRNPLPAPIVNASSRGCQPLR